MDRNDMSSRPEMIHSIVDSVKCMEMETGLKYEVHVLPLTFAKLLRDLPMYGITRTGSDVKSLYYDGVMFEMLDIFSRETGWAVLEVKEKEDDINNDSR